MTALAARIARAPKLAYPRAANQRIAELLADDETAPSGLGALLSQSPVRALLLGVADHSIFLWRLAQRDPARLARCLRGDPWSTLRACIAAMERQCDGAETDREAMRALRLARQEAALLIALADIGGVWSVDDAVAALSDFADAAVAAALRACLRAAADEGRLVLQDRDKPERACGLVVLALGKHGARELNYSSDVDLIVFFDPAAASLRAGEPPGPVFTRVARGLVRLLQERTEDDFVLRVDLRLRPDPGSTAIAISLPAAFSYYETLGQNWERAALVKARPIAGDRALGEGFLRDLAPFIWRKYFDYAAIADIHAMKRQIHAVRGHADVTVAGHNVKLGRGGIREVEFFVQTQQLIFGGRRPSLRGPRTLDMLVELARDGWITAEAVEDLSAAYRYLRMVEHRLQMIADEQTQRLPLEADDIARFARFLGYARVGAFENDLTDHLRRVETHYARLFEHAPGLDARAGSLVFTGVADDPETIATLQAMGFREPARAIEIVRGWHFGRRNALRGSRAREVVTEIVPALLEAFAGSGDPDAALATFDDALAGMPAAVELLSILKSNADVRELFADILGAAPRLAAAVTRRPHILDATIDPAVSRAAIDETAFEARVAAMARQAPRMEAFLDGARDIAQEDMFLIGVRALSGALDAALVGRAFSALAQAIVRATLARVEADFALEYGGVPTGRCAVVGMGRLGAREMTATSDLDLILIYEFDDAVQASDGPRGLHPAQYYTRLTQRLITALTVATRRGKLYEVDLRLRPSGSMGPVATRFRSFQAYQRREAETWEHMALTRARPVAGEPTLCAEAARAIRDLLAAERDARAVRNDVRAMRALIAREKGDADLWDLKLAAGGLTDIDFIAQYLILARAQAWPEDASFDVEAVIARAAGEGALTSDDCETLREARTLFSAVTQVARIAIEGPLDPATLAVGAARRMAQAAGAPDFKTLEAALGDTRAQVREIFRRVIG